MVFQCNKRVICLDICHSPPLAGLIDHSFDDDHDHTHDNDDNGGDDHDYDRDNDPDDYCDDGFPGAGRPIQPLAFLQRLPP